MMKLLQLEMPSAMMSLIVTIMITDELLMADRMI